MHACKLLPYHAPQSLILFTLCTEENVPLDSDHEDIDDSLGSSGSPPPTLLGIFSDPSSPPHQTFQENGEAMVSEVKRLQEKCTSYRMLLAQKDE